MVTKYYLRILGISSCIQNKIINQFYVITATLCFDGIYPQFSK